MKWNLNFIKFLCLILKNVFWNMKSNYFLVIVNLKSIIWNQFFSQVLFISQNLFLNMKWNQSFIKFLCLTLKNVFWNMKSNSFLVIVNLKSIIWNQFFSQVLFISQNLFLNMKWNQSFIKFLCLILKNVFWNMKSNSFLVIVKLKSIIWNRIFSQESCVLLKKKFFKHVMKWNFY